MPSAPPRPSGSCASATASRRSCPSAARRHAPRTPRRSAGAAATRTRPRSMGSARRPGGAPQVEPSAGKPPRPRRGGARRSRAASTTSSRRRPCPRPGGRLSAARRGRGRRRARARRAGSAAGRRARAAALGAQDAALHVLRARAGHGEASRHQAVRRGALRRRQAPREDAAARAPPRRPSARRGGRPPLPDRLQARRLRAQSHHREVCPHRIVPCRHADCGMRAPRRTGRAREVW